MDRPSTPPPKAYMLTPPPTGGFNKQESFADIEFDTKLSKDTAGSRRANKAKEGESPLGFFEDVQEGSDIDLAGLTEDESSSASNNSSPASPASNTLKFDEKVTLDLFDPSTSLKTPVPAEPFPFLTLPLSIRHKIYTHLLVIPGPISLRQNQSSLPTEHTSFLDTERRSLLPGIAHATAHITVSGRTVPFAHFPYFNISILQTSKEIHTESRAVLYSKNTFCVPRPSTELSPPADFSVRLFPAGCQRLVTHLAIKIRSFYDLAYLLSKAHAGIKNFYRGIKTLTLLLEIESMSKGFGRMWAREDDEKWDVYVKRLQGAVARDLCGDKVVRKGRVVPGWIDLRVMFAGEAYDVTIRGRDRTGCESRDMVKREDLRTGMVEVWGLFKKGGR
ncbi:hypothetical protein FB567DRAFT_438512 [Paraphoma chrysanthemicola]|uniref:Uncharacterized protein n=1 Tax=Paraphoma chrysanthemicola TaxID=798071 RepID=A0A8K0RE03_9PLEO|nr:hypothetical protein FB567DRAFT_438512 [Paraphoma chrysanthemicola]